MASTIGIKIADGKFYPLVEENSCIKKRLVLTTVYDNQRSVQIDLYKSFAKSMADAIYIGSLVVEKIGARSKGDPSIEMLISSTGDGNINAEAMDLDAGPRGEHQYLSVSLQSMDGDNGEYDIPDFEVEHHAAPPSGLYEKIMPPSSRKSYGIPLAALIAAIVIGVLIIIAAVWYFVFWDGSPAAAREENQLVPGREEALEKEPPVTAPQERVPEEDAVILSPPPKEDIKLVPAEPESAKEQEPPPVIEAPKEAPPPPAAIRRTRPVPPVSGYKVPAVIPRGGVSYRIRWGDTLWDISEAFYRNPWLYPRIARFNNIRNPDWIISGRTIRIPPRN